MKNTRKSTRISRALAWVLTFAMMLGIMPAYAFETPEELVENFTQVVLNFRSEYAKPEAERGTPMTATIEKNGWQVNQDRTAAGLILYNQNFYYGETGIVARVSDAGYPKHAEFTADFDVPTDGYYTIEMNGAYKNGVGAMAGVFVDDIFVGKYDFGFAGTSEDKDIGNTAKLQSLSLSAGKHKISFRRVNFGTGDSLMPGCVTFTRMDEMRGQANISIPKKWDENYLAGADQNPLAATIENDGWQLNHDRTAGSLLGRSNFFLNNYGLYALINDQGYPKHGELSLDFVIEKDGIYSATFTGSQFANDGGYGIIMIDDVPVGSYDFGNATGLNASWGETVKLSNTPLKAGVHTLSIRRVGGGASYRGIHPSFINFEQVGEYKSGASINFVKMWDSNYLNSQSRTPLNATIETDGYKVNGARTAGSLLNGDRFSASNYGLYAWLGDQGYPKHGEVAFDFKVDQDGTYDLNMAANHTVSGAAANIYVDGKFICSYDFTKPSSNLWDGPVKLGQVALKEGNHTLHIHRYGGNEYSPMRMAVSPSAFSFVYAGEMRNEYSIDFREYFAWAYLSDYSVSAEESPLNATIANNGWEIDKEASAASLSTTLLPSISRTGLNARITDSGYEKHSDVAIKFNVANGGKYKVFFSGSTQTNGTTVDILLDNKDIADFSFNGEYLANTDNIDLGDYDFTSGNHTITFRRKSGADNEFMYPGSIRLVEVDDVDATAEVKVFSTELETIGKGGIQTAEISATYGGEKVDMASAVVTVSSDNEQVATATLTAGDNGNAILTASGYELGTAKVKVAVSINGKVNGIVIPVTVAPGKDFRKMKVTLDKTSLEVGETANATVTAELMDGTPVEIDPDGLYISSSIPAVATVDNEGNIIAKSQGVTDIIAYAELMGQLRNAKATIAVTDFAPLASVSIKEPSNVSIGDKVQLSVEGKLASGNAADLTGATVEYTMVSCEPADAATLTAGGLLTANAEGKLSISAKVTMGDAEPLVTEIINVDITAVSDKPIKIDFSANQQGTPYQATIEKQGWQMNKTKSSPYIAEPTLCTYQTYGLYLRVWGLGAPVESDLSIDFNVPKAGAYKADIKWLEGSAGALLLVYVDGKYVGTIDCYSPVNESVMPTKSLNGVYFDAPGIHNVTFRRINWESGPQHDMVVAYDGNLNTMYLNSVTFTALTQMPEVKEIEVTADKQVYSVGESGKVQAVAKMTDGSSYDFGNLMSGAQDTANNIRFESLNTNIMTVDASGNLEAVASGEATIRAIARVSDKDFIKDYDITVDNNALESVSVNVIDEPVLIGQKRELEVIGNIGGRQASAKDMTVTCVSGNTEYVTIESTNGKFYAVGVAPGTAQITVTATLGTKTVNAVVDVEVYGDTFNTIEVIADAPFMKLTDPGTDITVVAKTWIGNTIDLSDAKITFESSDETVAKVSENGYVTPVALGSAVIKVTVEKGGVTRVGETNITVRTGKTQATYYTPTKVEAARENASKFDWAISAKNSVVRKADKYVDLGADYIWNAVTTQGLPRGVVVGYRYDPESAICRYCGVDMDVKYGSYAAWVRDTAVHDWKIQCPDCRRKFPSNDFASFYQLGIDENGNWNYEQAKAENQKLVDSGHQGYLVNILYPEVASVSTISNGKGLTGNETVEGWGVDDGFGYKTGRTYTTGSGQIDEVHTYIGYYNHWYLWYGGFLWHASDALRDAYLYTGDPKYGRLGAILVDRVADVYPDMKVGEYFPNFSNSDSTTPHGRITGCIWEHYLMTHFMQGYDAFFPMYQDPFVVSYLSDKAKQYNMDNAKSTPEMICNNIEDGILREHHQAVMDGDSYGNFGTHQSGLALAAVVLDTQPETDEWLEWLFKASALEEGIWSFEGNTGGDIHRQLVHVVDRDGMGNESSPQYTNLWLNSIQDLANTISGYVDNEKWDLYQNPKVIKMQTVEFELITARKATVQIGDSAGCANTSFNMYIDRLTEFYKFNKDYRIAQMIYFLNGNKVDGLKYDIFTPNPTSLQNEVNNVISQYGEYNFDKSNVLTGYGFAILRDGTYKASTSGAPLDTQQDAWMYYGQELRHGHLDMLNIGLEAFGLNISPDNGYPERADGGDLMLNSNHATISHNTVLVDNRSQVRAWRPGTTRHFDESDRVKLMSADGAEAYDNTNIYRRSVLMIRATDDISYYVDFFRVKGGDDHLYSFHALSDELESVDKNLKFVKQPMGSLAGPNVPYGTLGVTNGYSYFYDVRRAQAPKTGEFYADFQIKDFLNTLPGDRDLNLRMTMLNSFELSEVALAKTQPPQVGSNPKELEYVLARRSGKDLDTLFTTVFEPYEGKRYIESMEQVSITPVVGKLASDAEAKAIKVVLASGREDYIIHSQDSSREYLVDGKIRFKGAYGVYSLFNGECVYSYLHDGTILDEAVYEKAAVTGKVVDFTQDLVRKNTITVTVEGDVDVESLAGKVIYVDNDKEQSGAYRIVSASKSGKNVVLDIGEVTLVRRYKDTTNLDGGYTYNIDKEQTYTIPLTYVNDNGVATFMDISDVSAVVGNKITVPIVLDNPDNHDVVMTANVLPRGAEFDAETGILTWTPDKYQRGKHPIQISVNDKGLIDTLVFGIEVYASSSGSGNMSGGSSLPITPSTPSGGGSSGGGSAGGSTTPSTPETPDKPDAPETGEGTTDVPETPAEKFVDLGNHSWAKDAIYSLVDKGVINGTSANTYAPANNIKRADFAIMLVRAFGITEGEGENFADVDANKYYAEELRLAKATGIVNGIGNDKFNPEGEITRQDMMLMLSRALDAMEVELSEADLSVLSDFADAAQISDYAADAVSRMIKDGIIAGANGKINPLAKATRAEIAVMLDRVLADEK